MIDLRRARFTDAAGIASVHVATWRSAYATLLPEGYLKSLSVTRLTYRYERMIRFGFPIQVAIVHDTPGQPRVAGFSTASRARTPGLAEGEVETLYVLDDWQNQGLGRALLRASARHLAVLSCASAFAWVLEGNPSRYFYERLGGKRVAEGLVNVSGAELPQCAYVWNPLTALLEEPV